MTITSSTRRAQSTGNGVLTTYTYNFEVISQTDLEVYVDTVLQTLTTHYTVTGVGNNSGGTVEFVTAPANGTTVTIASNTPIERTTAFATGGAFKASTINTEFDKVVSMLNEIDGNLSRTIALQVTDTSATLTLPLKADRLGKFVSFDSVTGNLKSVQTVGTWQGNYAGATNYVQGDIFKDTSNSNIYFVKTDYTSSGTVATDVTAGNIALVIDSAAASTSAANAATSEANSATSATASATSASNAATSEANSSSSATASATSATASATSATNAATSESDASVSSALAQTSEVNAAASAASAAASAGAIDGKVIADTDGNTSVSTERTGYLEKVWIRANGTYVADFSPTAVNITPDVVITGNLTVNGTQTVVNSTTTAFADPLVVLSNGASSGLYDAGVVIDRGTDTNAAFIWDETLNRFSFQFTTDSGATAGTINDSGPTNLEIGALTHTGNILPTVTATDNIGSATKTYANGYITTIHGTSNSALYADLAEVYRGDMLMKKGNLVEIGGGEEITLSKGKQTTKVFGVISTNPAFLMNSGLEGTTCYPVALTGRVPILVSGKVSKGDALVQSTLDGVAEAIQEQDVLSSRSVVGRALEDKSTNEVGTIEAAIGKM